MIDIERALSAANEALGRGASLEGTGFWKAVAALRRNPELARRYGYRVAEIDRRAFEDRARIRVPAWVGTALLSAATAAGIAALALAGRLQGSWRTSTFLAAVGTLDLSTHTLAHVAVGRLLGIRFTHFFLGGPPPPRPGAKVDYESYLQASPQSRAVMHASGAVVTKLVPFASVPVAAALGQPGWVVAALLGAGALQIATDIAFSTKTSDWKKVRRELRAARAQG
ncbi:MAG: hypothetical protein ACRDJ4_06510 [Actinomycetota bacterium]